MITRPPWFRKPLRYRDVHEVLDPMIENIEKGTYPLWPQQLPSPPDRRVRARFPRPHPTLSVTLLAGIATRPGYPCGASSGGVGRPVGGSPVLAGGKPGADSSSTATLAASMPEGPAARPARRKAAKARATWKSSVCSSQELQARMRNCLFTELPEQRSSTASERI